MNYGELKALIDGQDGYLHRKDLTAKIPTFVVMAQSRISRDLEAPELVQRSVLSLSAGDRYVALPEDLHRLDNIQVSTSNGGRRLLLQVTPAQMDVFYDTPQSGPPKAYARYGQQIELQPAPAEATQLEIIYRKRLAAFVNDSQTDDILTLYPALYVYAVMLEISPFFQADERAEMWHTYYRNEIDRLNDIAETREYSGSPLQIISLGGSTP